MKHSLLFTLFVILLTLPARPGAQELNVGQIPFEQNAPPETGTVINKYDPKYRPQAIEAPQGSSLISSSFYSVYFVRPQDSSTGEAVLRISQPVSVNGCAEIDMPAPEIKINGRNMWVMLGKPDIRLRKDVRYAHYQCDHSPKAATVDITLDPETLKQHNIRQVKLQTKGGGVDTYNIELTENAIRLSPRSSRFFKPRKYAARADALRQWLYPDNTLILRVADAGLQDDLRKEISALARANDLVPLQDVIKNFTPPVNTENILYVVDKSGKTAQKIHGGTPVVLGSAQGYELYEEARGTYKKSVEYEVMAYKPGLFE